MTNRIANLSHNELKVFEVLAPNKGKTRNTLAEETGLSGEELTKALAGLAQSRHARRARGRWKKASPPDDFGRQLPEFKVTEIELDFGDGPEAQLEVKCKKCNRTALLDPTWLHSNELRTRPCTYCFKTSKIPAIHHKED